MNGKILIMLAAFMLLAYPASAYNQASPAAFNVRYAFTTITTFNVVTDQSELNFTDVPKTVTGAQPVGQDNATSDTWATIENDVSAQVPQTFKVKLTTLNPGITLFVSNNTDWSGQVTVGTVAVNPAAWANVQPGKSVAVYFRMNAISAADAVNTLTISAV